MTTLAVAVFAVCFCAVGWQTFRILYEGIVLRRVADISPWPIIFLVVAGAVIYGGGR